ncbi:MAG: hypothetical protein AABX16_04960 [Nanoarchaeota archaeon]
MQVLTVSEKKKVVAQLNNQFGVNEIQQMICKFGEERYRVFSGNLSREQLLELDKTVRIESTGLYFARQNGENIRLTIDGVHFLKEKIQKNFFEISRQDMEKWLRGEDLEIAAPRAFLILTHDNYSLGCGKSSGKIILNSVPKERRIKN